MRLTLWVGLLSGFPGAPHTAPASAAVVSGSALSPDHTGNHLRASVGHFSRNDSTFHRLTEWLSSGKTRRCEKIQSA